RTAVDPHEQAFRLHADQVLADGLTGDGQLLREVGNVHAALATERAQNHLLPLGRVRRARAASPGFRPIPAAALRRHGTSTISRESGTTANPETSVVNGCRERPG